MNKAKRITREDRIKGGLVECGYTQRAAAKKIDRHFVRVNAVLNRRQVSEPILQELEDLIRRHREEAESDPENHKSAA